MSNSWTDYWSSGVLDSCPEHSSLYTEFFCSFWLSELKRMSDSRNNIKILDIATGNGVVPLFFVKNISKDMTKLDIIGIDKAKISPQKFRNYLINKDHSVNFISNTSAEIMPFVNNEFDWIVSQFGIEYSIIEKSLVEAIRVLKHSGRWTFVCHFENSEIIVKNKEVLECSNQLLSHWPIFNLTLERVFLEKQMLENQTESNKNKLRKVEVRVSSIISSMLNSNEHKKNYFKNVINASNQIYVESKSMSFADVKSRVDFAIDALKNSIQRLFELDSAAMVSDRLGIFEKIIKQEGGDIEKIRKMKHQGRYVAIELSGVKNS